MKKLLTIFIFYLLIFSFINVNAEELNCKKYLRRGSSGVSVKVLQTKLNQYTDCNLAVDGAFGKKTAACVKKFQRLYDLDVDGIVGPKTCSKINSLAFTTLIKTPDLEDNEGYIYYKNVNVREASSTASNVLFRVHRGDKVLLSGIYDGWYSISVNGLNGYIRSDLITKTLIVVDIVEQRFVYYKNGKNVLETTVVTGRKGKHDTPVGAYILSPKYFKCNATLRGRNDDGSRYASHVDYWMPFILDVGIGFHDATWRKEYEFNSYQYISNGSHGCVNMRYDAAKELYESIYEDTLVIIRG